MSAWHELWTAAADQDQVVTAAQASALGVPVSTFNDLVARHGCVRPQPRTVAAPGSTTDLRLHMAAALQSVGQPAAIAGRAAGWLHGLVPTEPRVADLLVPYGRGAPAVRHPLKAVRTRRWDAVNPVEVDGLTVAGPAWSLIDVAATMVHRDVPSLVIDAVQQDIVDVAALRLALQARTRVKGRSRLVGLLDDVESGIQSVFERLIPPILRAAGLPLPRAQFTVTAADGRVIHLDFGYDEWPVAIECVGLAAHRTRKQLVADVKRLNGMRGTRIRVVWVEWTGLLTNPHAVAADIATELWRAGARWPGGPSIRLASDRP